MGKNEEATLATYPESKRYGLCVQQIPSVPASELQLHPLLHHVINNLEPVDIYTMLELLELD